MLHSAAAFLTPGMIQQVANEVFHRTQQITAEPATIWVRPRKSPRQQMSKERVCMIACHVCIETHAA